MLITLRCASFAPCDITALHLNIMTYITITATRVVGAPSRLINTFLTKGENVVVQKVTNSGYAETVGTLFGSTSTLGPYVTERLARQGLTLVLPYRDDYSKVRHNKILGEVGQVVPLPTDLFDKESVEKSVVNSNIVVNMIGAHQTTLHYNLHDANVKTAHRIAKIAKENGVTRFIHVSAMGAAPDSKSDVLRCKYESELAVKSFFPNASIIRPAPMYNHDSRLICEIGRAAVQRFHITYGSDALIQPVSYEDVSLAIQQIAMNPEIDGQTWELAGDTKITRGELAELCRLITDYKSANFFELKSCISVPLAHLMDKFMVPKYFRPHGLRTGRAEYDACDLVINAAAPTDGIKTLQDLGITPRPFKLGVIKALKPYVAADSVVQAGVDGVGVSKWQPHGKEAVH